MELLQGHRLIKLRGPDLSPLNQGSVASQSRLGSRLFTYGGSRVIGLGFNEELIKRNYCFNAELRVASLVWDVFWGWPRKALDPTYA